MRRALAIGAAAGAAAALVGRPAHADAFPAHPEAPENTMPPCPHSEGRSLTGANLLSFGALSFTLGYGLIAAFAVGSATLGLPDAWRGLVPIVGPFLYSGAVRDAAEFFWPVLLMDSVFQIVGIVLLVSGGSSFAQSLASAAPAGPPGRCVHRWTRGRTWLVAVATALAATAYGLNAFVSISSGLRGNATAFWGLSPLIGPFLTIGAVDPQGLTAYQYVYVPDSLVQVVALAILLAEVADYRWSWYPSAERRAWTPRVVPMIAPNVAGFAVRMEW